MGKKALPPPPPPPRPKRSPGVDPFARALAETVREAHGVDQASTLDMSENIGAPRGFVGTRNVAIDRALGSRLPLGRFTEISGWEGAGKSTILDQILAECQAEGGVAVLADTERTRNRAYMRMLGVQPESMVWIGGKTVESMFEEVETLTRKVAAMNAIAWYEALERAGVKVPKMPMYKYNVFDPDSTSKDKDGKKKPISTHVFPKWSREQAAALLQYQIDNGLPKSSVRDDAAREALRPCVLFTDDKDDRKEALAAWARGEAHPLVQGADRPVVIGWDSVAGTATEREMEGSIRDKHPAVAASVIKAGFRRLTQLIDDEAIGFVMVNQRYAKINAGGQSWGQKGRGPSETYGGSGIKYHTTIRIEVERVGSLWPTESAKKAGDPPMGQIVRVRVPKNKVNDPFHKEEFALIFGRGADNAWAIYQDLKARGIIRSGGGWASFTDKSIIGDRKFRGWMELANLMSEDDNLWATLRTIYMEGR